MPEIAISVDKDTKEALEEEAYRWGYLTREDYIHEILERRDQAHPLRASPDYIRSIYEAKLAECERELNDRETWIATLYERLDRAQKQIVEKSQNTTTGGGDPLQEAYTLEERRRRGDLIDRIRWKLFGMD